MDENTKFFVGLDVHKETIAACLIREDANGNTSKEKRLFGTVEFSSRNGSLASGKPLVGLQSVTSTLT